MANLKAGSANYVEEFHTADHRTALVQAMAAFTPPAPGQTTLPPSYQQVLAPLLAGSWG